MKTRQLIVLLMAMAMVLPSCKKDAEIPSGKTFPSKAYLNVNTYATNTGPYTAELGGSVDVYGKTKVIEFGVCWSTHHDPTIEDNQMICEGDEEGFSCNITGLTPETTYYVRAYATYIKGISYGFETSFITPPDRFTIAVSANPSDGGIVTGEGIYQEGQTCTVSATANNGFSFINWTEDGNVVSSDSTYSFTVDSNRTLEANFFTHIQAPVGAIGGLFSINDNGDQVFFSKGNLQYRAINNTWRFAVHQWDYVGTQTPDQDGNYGGTVDGSDNVNASESYSGWIDLFSWGTSGYNHGAVCYQPWSNSTNYNDYWAYGDSQSHLYDQTGQADWGYNPVINGGDTENTWRTLTKDEWVYLFNTRSTLTDLRYVLARVNEVDGVILLPDQWQSDYYELNHFHNYTSSNNVISREQWSTLERFGAVFLPLAGLSYGGTYAVSYAGQSGNYWSSTGVVPYKANSLGVSFSGANPNDVSWRIISMSVRLVRSAN